jgi:hypothetical protein
MQHQQGPRVVQIPVVGVGRGTWSECGPKNSTLVGGLLSLYSQELNERRKRVRVKKDPASFERSADLPVACVVLEALAAGVRILGRAVLPPGCPGPDWVSWFQVNAGAPLTLRGMCADCVGCLSRPQRKLVHDRS